MLSLSHTVGNSALTELYALQNLGPETAYFPAYGALDTAPWEQGGGVPELADAPAFGAMSPMAPTAPLSV